MRRRWRDGGNGGLGGRLERKGVGGGKFIHFEVIGSSLSFLEANHERVVPGVLVNVPFSIYLSFLMSSYAVYLSLLMSLTVICLSVNVTSSYLPFLLNVLLSYLLNLLMSLSSIYLSFLMSLPPIYPSLHLHLLLFISPSSLLFLSFLPFTVMLWSIIDFPSHPLLTVIFLMSTICSFIYVCSLFFKFCFSSLVHPLLCFLVSAIHFPRFFLLILHSLSSLSTIPCPSASLPVNLPCLPFTYLTTPSVHLS